MKKIILLNTLLFLFLTGQSQTYNVGTPVYDTLFASPGGPLYNSTSSCYNYCLRFDSSLTQDPAGTQVYFKITGGTMQPGSLQEINYGTLYVNDSILITPSTCFLQFFSSVPPGAGINWAFIRCGTPTLQNDSFICKQNIHIVDTVLYPPCGITRHRAIYHSGTDSCKVDGPLSSGFNEISDVIHLQPNPTSDKVTIGLPVSGDKNFTVEVIDVMGRIVTTESVDSKLNGRNIELDFSGFISGVYIVHVTSETTMYSGRVVKK